MVKYDNNILKEAKDDDLRLKEAVEVGCILSVSLFLCFIVLTLSFDIFFNWISIIMDSNSSINIDITESWLLYGAAANIAIGIIVAFYIYSKED